MCMHVSTGTHRGEKRIADPLDCEPPDRCCELNLRPLKMQCVPF